MLQDYQLIEKLAHQNRKRVPVAHGARQGLGHAWHAHHYKRHFQIYQGEGAASWRKTPMLARFSIVAGELGAADTERDVRGFALKFYTEEGNWDLVWQQHAVVPLPVRHMNGYGSHISLINTEGERHWVLRPQ